MDSMLCCLHLTSPNLSRIANTIHWLEASCMLPFAGFSLATRSSPFSPSASLYQLFRIDIQGFEVWTFALPSSNRFGNLGLNFKRLHGRIKCLFGESEKKFSISSCGNSGKSMQTVTKSLMKEENWKWSAMDSYERSKWAFKNLLPYSLS